MDNKRSLELDKPPIADLFAPIQTEPNTHMVAEPITTSRKTCSAGITSCEFSYAIEVNEEERRAELVMVETQQLAKQYDLALAQQLQQEAQLPWVLPDWSVEERKALSDFFGVYHREMKERALIKDISLAETKGLAQFGVLARSFALPSAVVCASMMLETMALFAVGVASGLYVYFSPQEKKKRMKWSFKAMEKVEKNETHSLMAVYERWVDCPVSEKDVAVLERLVDLCPQHEFLLAMATVAQRHVLGLNDKMSGAVFELGLAKGKETLFQIDQIVLLSCKIHHLLQEDISFEPVLERVDKIVKRVVAHLPDFMRRNYIKMRFLDSEAEIAEFNKHYTANARALERALKSNTYCDGEMVTHLYQEMLDYYQSCKDILEQAQGLALPKIVSDEVNV